LVFSSLFFIFVFLPLNIILNFLVKKQSHRNIVLVAFSLFFYAWGEPVWIIILLISATIDFFHGQIVEKYAGRKQAKWALVSSVIMNLSLLVIFKYSDFIYQNVNALFGTDFELPGIALPIGISFYTFQTISYTVDVYRGKVKAQRSFLKFMLFVTMYHQLVAGPIVRYSVIEDEIENREINYADSWAGFCRFCVGLFKKVMVANTAGALAAQYMEGDLSVLSSAGAIFGLLMYTVQIYYDFSGYSDMAIGMGRIFGFHYDENFNYPYIAGSVTDFWRRWHISLSSFFKDYVYIPLGGKYRFQMRNITVVWLLTGLWHGASWNFIIWGAYYGLLLIIEKTFLLNLLKKVPAFIGHIYSIAAIMVGWAIFYFTDIADLQAFFKALFTGGFKEDASLYLTISNNIFWLIGAVAFCMPIMPALKKWIYSDAISEKKLSGIMMGQALGCIVILFICTAMLVGESYNPFLYFRF